MQFELKVTLTEEDVEEIILKELSKVPTPGLGYFEKVRLRSYERGAKYEFVPFVATVEEEAEPAPYQYPTPVNLETPVEVAAWIPDEKEVPVELF